MILDGKAPTGRIQDSWDKHRFELKLVNPANKRKFRIVVVGSGLAGASAAATLGELGYHVDLITFQAECEQGVEVVLGVDLVGKWRTSKEHGRVLLADLQQHRDQAGLLDLHRCIRPACGPTAPDRCRA